MSAPVHVLPAVRLGPSGLTPADVVAVARGGARVELDPAALAAVARTAARVAELAASPTPAYGVSTGFGALATRHIAPTCGSSCSAR